MIWLLNIAIMTGGVSGRLTSGPNNTAALVGSSVELSCSTNKDVPINWFYYPYNSTGGLHEILFKGQRNKYNPKFGPRFHVTINNDTKTSTLAISSVRINDTGLYGCREHLEESGYDSRLFVFASNCFINSSNGEVEVEEGDKFEVACQTRYAGNWAPCISCSVESNQLESCSYGQYRRTVTASPAISGNTYTCKASFNTTAVSRRLVIAENIPSLRLWTSPIVSVLYGPQNVLITPANISHVNAGDKLKCSAEGNPAPTFKWIDLYTNNVVREGSELTLKLCDQQCQPSAGCVQLSDNKVRLQCIASVERRHRTTDATNATFTAVINKKCSNGSHLGSNVYYISGGAILIIVAAAFVVGIYLKRTGCSKKTKMKQPDLVETAVPDVAAAVYAEVHHNTTQQAFGQGHDSQLVQYAVVVPRSKRTAASRNEIRHQEDTAAGPTTTADDSLPYAELQIMTNREKSSVKAKTPHRPVNSPAIYAEIDHTAVKPPPRRYRLSLRH